MDGRGPDTHNQVHGGDLGAVVQAGAIHHLTFYQPGQPPVVPRQLPLAAAGFTGRAEHLATLDALLPTSGGYAEGTVVISAVDGTAGVGKTTLAVHWAHRVQHHFPDGTLFVNLRGYDPTTPATTDEVLPAFLHALGVPPENLPPSLHAQTGLYRSILAGRRVLIVLDNASSTDQVRQLLPGTAGCLVLITSRASLTGLVIGHSATRLTLDLLTPAEAHQLLHTLLGPARLAAEPEATATLIHYCARLPLALRLAAGHALAYSHTTLSELAAEMADARHRLDLLTDTDDPTLAVRAVFAWSYQRLTDNHARLFRRLGLHPGPEFSLAASAAIAGTELDRARRLLTSLTQAHLVQQTARDRYRFHDLLRAYASELADTEDHPDDQTRLHQVVLEWYAHHAKAALQVASPAHSSWYPPLEIPTSAYPEVVFTDPAEAWNWVRAEWDNLVAAARRATERNPVELALLLWTAVSWFSLYRARFGEARELLQLCGMLARRIGDRITECTVLQMTGEHLAHLGRWDEALDVYWDALALARELGDPWREACSLLDLGSWCNKQGRHADALGHLWEALPLCPGAQHGRLEGVIECQISAALAGLGDFEQALPHAERGVMLRRHAGDNIGEAWSLEQLARACQGLGRHQQAIAVCEQALSNTERFFLLGRAGVLDTLGVSLGHTGDTTRAIACWREALAIYEDFEDYRAADLHERLRMLDPGGHGPG